jgi:prophage regulatory protein
MSDSIRREPSILRRRQVEARTGLARSTIYQYIKDGAFPKPVQLGPRAVGWIESEVSEWIGARSKVAGGGVRQPPTRA